MKEPRMKELIEIANSLSNEDVCHLLDMLSDRMMVWVSDEDGNSSLIDVENADLNGSSVQINLKRL